MTQRSIHIAGMDGTMVRSPAPNHTGLGVHTCNPSSPVNAGGSEAQGQFGYMCPCLNKISFGSSQPPHLYHQSNNRMCVPEDPRRGTGALCHYPHFGGMWVNRTVLLTVPSGLCLHLVVVFTEKSEISHIHLKPINKGIYEER